MLTLYPCGADRHLWSSRQLARLPPHFCKAPIAFSGQILRRPLLYNASMIQYQEIGAVHDRVQTVSYNEHAPAEHSFQSYKCIMALRENSYTKEPKQFS